MGKQKPIIPITIPTTIPTTTSHGKAWCGTGIATTSKTCGSASAASAADARPSQVITECALRDTRSSITLEAQLRSGEGSRAFHPHSVLNRGNTTTSREKRGTRAGTTNWKPCANNYKKKQSVTRNASPWAKSSPTRNGSLNGQRNSNSQEAKAFKAASTPLSWKWQAYNKKNSAPKRRGSRC